MKKDLDYLDHILECLEWIENHVCEGREFFFKDRKTQSAVLREIQILAESTQRLSAGLKEGYQEISWQAISGFRNVLVHDYLGLNLERVWNVVERDLPSLKVAVIEIREQVLKEIK